MHWLPFEMHGSRWTHKTTTTTPTMSLIVSSTHNHCHVHDSPIQINHVNPTSTSYQQPNKRKNWNDGKHGFVHGIAIFVMNFLMRIMLNCEKWWIWMWETCALLHNIAFYCDYPCTIFMWTCFMLFTRGMYFCFVVLYCWVVVWPLACTFLLLFSFVFFHAFFVWESVGAKITTNNWNNWNFTWFVNVVDFILCVLQWLL